MKKYLISLPYVYPVCPISLDHARMFVVADIVARIKRRQGMEVCFPVASHFSGVTAEKTCYLLNNSFDKDSKEYNEKQKIINIFSKIYKIPDNILNQLKSPEDILYYFTYQIISNFKSINISCDYDSFYTTYDEEFEDFVRIMFNYYEKNGMLINNSKGELALNYSNKKWHNNALTSLNKIEFIQEFHKKNILGAFDNIREDFGLLRNYGIGIKYNDNYVIDPMFDSDLFTLFDLFVKIKKNENKEYNVSEVFNEVFIKLKDDSYVPKNDVVKKIIKWLPCDLFVCEEHLKTWIVKKTYSETLLLDTKYRTKKYFITGMGKINNERMSSSRGTAVLLKDLIDEYGPDNARIIILMTSGHPSKLYNYDINLPDQVVKMTSYFKEYLNYLYSILLQKGDESDERKFSKDEELINGYINDGYYQQALVHMMKIIPKSNKNVSYSEAKELIRIYNEYLDLLVPNFIKIKL